MGRYGIAAGSAFFTDGPNMGSIAGSTIGAWAGGKFGELKIFYEPINDIFGGLVAEVISNRVKDKANGNNKNQYTK
ncbi:hypothetical protein QMS78_10265 [Cronobacter dublinensis]|uniref:hypothetical protein n=1 Tax=Cronobacter dublinensis TaxID=413497 RepID=UPI0024C25C45|nr:hypothetical protein [Cronobacter dublinensis]MDK1252872.1 hypothetical protein [Cronobacter dublinensis]